MRLQDYTAKINNIRPCELENVLNRFVGNASLITASHPSGRETIFSLDRGGSVSAACARLTLRGPC